MTSPTYKLTYFNGRGRAEIIRLVLTAADVPFEDYRIDHADFAKVKESNASLLQCRFYDVILQDSLQKLLR